MAFVPVRYMELLHKMIGMFSIHDLDVSEVNLPSVNHSLQGGIRANCFKPLVTNQYKSFRNKSVLASSLRESKITYTSSDVSQDVIQISPLSHLDADAKDNTYVSAIFFTRPVSVGLLHKTLSSTRQTSTLYT